MNKRLKWLGVVCSLAGLIILSPSGPACGEKLNEKTLSPYFFVEGGDPSLDRFPLKETDVKVNISGVIADVYVTQTYTNEGTRPIHARYVFPASTRASVHGLKPGWRPEKHIERE